MPVRFLTRRLTNISRGEERGRERADDFLSTCILTLTLCPSFFTAFSHFALCTLYHSHLQDAGRRDMHIDIGITLRHVQRRSNHKPSIVFKRGRLARSTRVYYTVRAMWTTASISNSVSQCLRRFRLHTPVAPVAFSIFLRSPRVTRIKRSRARLSRINGSGQ